MSTSNGAGLKRGIFRFVQRKIANPMMLRTAGNRGNRYAVLETIGRTSGIPRQNPVGNGLAGDTFWFVAEFGEHAQYVKNLRANPRVRVRADGSWRSGSAVIMPDDNPRERQHTLDQLNARVVRIIGTDLLTIRIDLDHTQALRPIEPDRRGVAIADETALIRFSVPLLLMGLLSANSSDLPNRGEMERPVSDQTARGHQRVGLSVNLGGA